MLVVLQEGRKLGYGTMQGIPMIASSPVRHESPLGMNPVEVQSYQPPWKALSDFALHTDLDRLDPSAPPFQQLVNQVSTYNTTTTITTLCVSLLQVVMRVQETLCRDSSNSGSFLFYGNIMKCV